MTSKRARDSSGEANGRHAAEANGHAAEHATAAQGAGAEAGVQAASDSGVAASLEAELGTASEATAGADESLESAVLEHLEGEELENAVLALLFASPEALSIARLVQLLPGSEVEAVKNALAALAERVQLARLPLELRELGGGWRFMTTPSMAWIVVRLARARKIERISPAALETLAIVSYRQPVTKVEIEAIRGVQAGPVLRSLIDRRLVKVCGKADQPGSPLQYGTTREFLDQFGLASLKDLPRDAELVKD